MYSNTYSLSVISQKSCQYALYLYFIRSIDHRRHGGISRVEDHFVGFLLDLLQGHLLIVDQGYHDIAVVGSILLLDDHVVAIK